MIFFLKNIFTPNDAFFLELLLDASFFLEIPENADIGNPRSYLDLTVWKWENGTMYFM